MPEWLDVGDGHRLWFDQHGPSDGRPVVVLHGGPGSGNSERALAPFDLERHRVVLFDQRASGRSTPHASEPPSAVDWATIDLDHHIADIEQLRTELGIDRWSVCGMSWGSVLAIAYAQRHPDRVSAVVVGAVAAGTRDEVDWLTVGVGRYFPEQWEALMDHIPAALRDLRLVDAYHRLVMDPDPAVHEPAAEAWCRWEDSHVAVAADYQPNPRYLDPRFRLGFARQVTHHWSNDCWLADDELVANAGRLAGIGGRLVHGRIDLSTPLESAWRLHRAWPGSELVVVEGDGHGGATITSEVRRAVAEVA